MGLHRREKTRSAAAGLCNLPALLLQSTPKRLQTQKEEMRNIIKHYKKYFKGKCLDLGATPATMSVIPAGSTGINLFSIPTCSIIDHNLNTNYIPFPDKHFDFILFSHTIEHLNSPHLILKECYRVLKDSGKIIIAIPRFVFWERTQYHPRPKIKLEDWHKYFWSGKTFKHMLKTHNFKVLRSWVNYYPNLPVLYWLFQYTPLRLISKDIHFLCEKQEYKI